MAVPLCPHTSAINPPRVRHGGNVGKTIQIDPAHRATVEEGGDVGRMPCDVQFRNGLDQSIPVQFGYYISNLARGDLGESFRSGRTVIDILAERLPVTNR